VPGSLHSMKFAQYVVLSMRHSNALAAVDLPFFSLAAHVALLWEEAKGVEAPALLPMT